MIYYGEQKSQKIELPKPITEADGHYHDDPLQMGGNVIINSQGEVIQIYASQFPADRPEVEDMLIVLSRSITNWCGNPKKNLLKYYDDLYPNCYLHW